MAGGGWEKKRYSNLKCNNVRMQTRRCMVGEAKGKDGFLKGYPPLVLLLSPLEIIECAMKGRYSDI